VSQRPVTIGFKQHIGATDRAAHRQLQKTLTYTLSHDDAVGESASRYSEGRRFSAIRPRTSIVVLYCSGLTPSAIAARS
jgi:hypothetical protein